MEHLEDYTDRCGNCIHFAYSVKKSGKIVHWGHCEVRQEKIKQASGKKCEMYEPENDWSEQYGTIGCH